MSMPTNNEYRTPDTVEDTTVEPRRTMSPVLLLLLASFDPGAVAGAPDGGYALADHLEAERWARAAADARIAASGNPASGTPASGTPAEGR